MRLKSDTSDNTVIEDLRNAIEHFDKSKFPEDEEFIKGYLTLANTLASIISFLGYSRKNRQMVKDLGIDITIAALSKFDRGRMCMEPYDNTN